MRGRLGAVRHLRPVRSWTALVAAALAVAVAATSAPVLPVVPVAPAAAQGAESACPSRVPDAGFTDTRGSGFERAIDCIVWWEIAEGRSSTRYEPGARVTRRQMAIFLHRFVAATAPELARDPGGRSPFSDVPDEGVGAREIRVLASLRSEGTPLLEGYDDGTFRPTNSVTRAQMASFVTRTVRAVADHLGTSLASGGCSRTFPDRERIPEVHRPSVTFVCAQDIAEGRADGTYGPSDAVRRGQMAAFLTRALDVFVRRGAVSPPR